MPSETQGVEDVEIRRESAAERIEDAVKILNETRLHASADGERCRWMYLRNPAGVAQLWTAVAADRCVGFAALVPRRMYVEGAARTAWITADLSVLPAYRRRGLAGAMRSAARRAVDAGEVDILYGHPNDKSSGAHRKAGFAEIGEMCRYAAVVRTESYVARLVPVASLARMLAEALDSCLGLAARVRIPRGISVEPVERFDARFDALDATESRRMPGIVGVRDAAYLNWRYFELPGESIRVLAATSLGTLRGYAVMRYRVDAAEILDLFPYSDARVVTALLASCLSAAQKEHMRSVSASLLEENPVIPLLRRMGFRMRADHSRMFAYAAAGSPWASSARLRRAWYIWDGDRDI